MWTQWGGLHRVNPWLGWPSGGPSTGSTCSGFGINCTAAKTILYVDPVGTPRQGQPLAWLTLWRPLHRVHVFWVRKAIVKEQKRYFMWTRLGGLHRVNNRLGWPSGGPSTGSTCSGDRNTTRDALPGIQPITGNLVKMIGPQKARNRWIEIRV